MFGNLKSVTLPNATVIDYVVDGRNRRVAKKINGAITQKFLYQGQLRIAAELDATNAVLSRFVYGTKVNVPEYMTRGADTFRIVTDHLGSVRLVVNTATGAIAQRIDYDEFGNVTADTNPGFQPFGFAGGLQDNQTKLVWFGARDYDAQTGRWTAKDPIRFRGEDANLYAYVRGDPISYIDATGKNPVAVARIGWGIGWRVGEIINPYVQPLISRAIDPFIGYDDALLSVQKDDDSSKVCPPERADKQKKGKPENNQDQNKRARDAATEAGLDTEGKETLQRELELQSREMGENLTYKDILTIAKDIKAGRL